MSGHAKRPNSDDDAAVSNLRTPGARVVTALLVIGLGACSVPTAGPAVRIGHSGWTVDPPSVVQPGDRFEFVVENSLDVDVEFVLLRMDYGDVADLPLAGGLVDVTRQVVYDGEVPVVAYTLYPDGVGPDWEPWKVKAGSSTTVNVGTSLGGGEPGRFAVIAYQPGAILAGDYVVFDMTDEEGQVPQFSLEDFHPSDDAS